MDTSQEIEFFYKERGTVLNDIRHFLQIVLRLLVTVKEDEILVHHHQLENLDFLIESLCLIHGLYLYPKEGGKRYGKRILFPKIPLFHSRSTISNLCNLPLNI